MRLLPKFLLAGLTALALVGSTRADFTTSFSFGPTLNANGVLVSATADFVATGSTLTVTLTNTGPGAIGVPTDVLTAVFFSITGTPTLTRTSAILNAGSDIANASNSTYSGTGGLNPADGVGVVGGEWANKNVSAHGATTGISSSGFGLFGAGDRFPGSDLQPPPSPDGPQYGIVNASYVDGQGNTGVTASALIRSSVVFTLDGLPTGLTAADISNVVFQYGTALDEPSFPGDNGGGGGGGGGLLTPEPASVTLLAFGGFGLLAGALRRRKVVA